MHILIFVTSQKSGTVLATENAHVQTLILSCKAETQFSKHAIMAEIWLWYSYCQIASVNNACENGQGYMADRLET